MAGSIKNPVGERLLQDLSFAIRQLRRAPSFAIAAAATLAIGIGATAAVFSVIDAVVLRPLPFAQPDRVVNVHLSRNGSPIPIASNLEFAEWRAAPRAFSSVAAFVTQTSFTLLRGSTPELVRGGRVTADYLRVLGVNPQIGRGFGSAADQPGAPHEVLLSHRLWARDYDSRPSIVGQSVQMDGEPYLIVGVMPASFDFLGGGDELWAPLTLSPIDLQNFRARYLQVIGRLAPGVSLAQATSIVDGVEQRLMTERPAWGKGYTALATRYVDDLVGPIKPRLYVLMGAVCFVFLIACVNVANLLLARGSTRAREMAVRAALGAERGRLVGQLLTESAVLSFAAGVAGIVLAAVLVRALVAMSPPGIPRIEQTTVDPVVLAFTLGVSAACSLIIGLLPALRAAGPNMQSSLRDGGRGAGDGRVRERTRNLLVAAEVALAVALLSGAALLIRSAWEIAHVDPGFDGHNVLTAQVFLPQLRYPDLPSAARVYRAIHDELSTTSGVQAVAFTSSLPLTASIRSGLGAEGQPMTDGERLITEIHLVSAGYFRALKIKVKSGREFVASDGENAPLVAIINEALAKKFWPGQAAIGKRIEGMDPSHQHLMTVVGVVADQRDVSLNQPPAPEFYIPYEQTPAPLWANLQGSLVVVARTAGRPASFVPELNRVIDGVDPTLPVSNIATMDEIAGTSQATAHFNTVLLALLGAIALILAIVGVYGLIAYSVSQRTREIGLRIALGATSPKIATLIIGRGLAPIAMGAAMGALLAVATTRVLRDQLYGVSAGDPFTIAGIAVALVVVATLAACVPTYRAIRISPMQALAA